MKRVMPLAVLTLFLSTAASARIDPLAFRTLAFQQHPGAQLPLSAELHDEAGRSITLGSALGGRPAIVVLEYLRCQNLCSLVLSGATGALVRAQLTPGRQVNLIAVSIDPRDTSADAAASRGMYSRRFPNPAAAAQGIRFLTGAPDQVADIAKAIGFRYRVDQQSDQFAHPAGFVVVTPSGRISRYMLGLNPPAAAVSKAVADAGRGAVTPAVHPLLLLCFGYDPDAGTAAALAMRLVRLVSLGTLLACAGLIALLSFRRRTA